MGAEGEEARAGRQDRSASVRAGHNLHGATRGKSYNRYRQERKSFSRELKWLKSN